MSQSSRELSPHERRIVDAILKNVAISRDALKDAHENRTFGERVADRIAAFGGSWTFILTCLGLLSLWIVINTWVLAGDRVFDPFPFILLNLGLSMLAALQAPVILMSQNRQAARDRADAEHDYETNRTNKQQKADKRQGMNRVAKEFKSLEALVSSLTENAIELDVPKTTNAAIIPRVRPRSPTRLTRKAFIDAAFAESF